MFKWENWMLASFPWKRSPLKAIKVFKIIWTFLSGGTFFSFELCVRWEQPGKEPRMEEVVCHAWSDHLNHCTDLETKQTSYIPALVMLRQTLFNPCSRWGLAWTFSNKSAYLPRCGILKRWWFYYWAESRPQHFFFKNKTFPVFFQAQKYVQDVAMRHRYHLLDFSPRARI